MHNAMRSTMIGAGLGATAMFLLDPARGARRRALVRDKMTRAARKTRDAYGATRRDVGNRIAGVNAVIRQRRDHAAVDDTTLRERVRAALGRVASHPAAIQVHVSNGAVTLTGDVLASEGRAIERAIRRVHGVEDVHNQMMSHRSADGVPSLQGSSTRPGRWSSWARSGWSPTARLVAGVGAASVASAVVMSRS